MNQLIECIYQDLLPNLQIESLNPYNPVVVHQFPQSWHLLGTGNYSAVFGHPVYPHQVVKIYAPGRRGLQEEAEVYRRLGEHSAFSACLYAGEDFLVLKRLYGVTLYDCMHQGVPIPPQVIEDIDRALDYARQRGLSPHDVHGRNVMMQDGRGLVVDVSDFLQEELCSAWDDLKRAYHWFYIPFFSRLHVKIPYFMLNLIRVSYRHYRRLAPLRLHW
ncbi:MAG: serine/threonine protein kinase [Cyanothece sp. SIO1E1]|nr:serine/threonine protein kinase [Cyanothece sp. SIO1E1]